MHDSTVSQSVASPDVVTVVFNRPEAEALYRGTESFRKALDGISPETREKYLNTPYVSALNVLKEALDA